MFAPRIKPTSTTLALTTAAILTMSVLYTVPNSKDTDFIINSNETATNSNSPTILTAMIEQAPPVVTRSSIYEKGQFSSISSAEYSQLISVPVHDLPEA